ncbi:hypothetical protein N9E56_02620, partial [Flavobacteriaceae bacterium]|nr:hypothetical protein [Flavobacteriaceae bacterium]
MRHFILAFLLISLSGFSQTISKQVAGPAGAATFERGLSTSLCEGTSGNQLVNPSFEVPSVTNIGNNFLTWPINGWNGVGSAPNFVKVNGVAGQGGPISAQEGVQYLDIVAGSADFYQEFDFQCNTQVFFSGYFSVRDGLTSTGRIDILRVNSDNATDIVASSNQLNMPSTANIWYLASGDAVLPAGKYRFNISMGNHSNFDSACFSFDNPNIDTGSYGPLCESSSITLTGTPTDSFGSWTGSGIVDNGDGTASFNPSGLGGTAVTVTYSHFNASGFGCSQSTNIAVNPNITPTFTQVAAIFNGETLGALPTTSNNGVTGTWSPAINNTETTTYTFTPDDSETCAINQTMTISVNTIPFSVAVNSEIICSSGIATLVATPSPAGFYSYTWIVPEGVNNPGNVQSFSTSIEGDYSVSISKDNYLCNTDFEENQLGILGSHSIVHQDSVPCWETTASDSQIEVWGDEMNGINAYSGNQFIELNANMQSTLFQNFEIIPGSSVILSFAHRGRNSSADDIMEVEIGPIGGPYVNLGAFSDGIDSWGYYSLDYVLPDDLGINYTIRFKSIQPAGSLGNFLDDISVVFPSDVSSEIATGNVSIITEITPTFTQIPAICDGDALSELLTTSNNGITGTWSPSLDTTATTTYAFTPDADQCAATVNMTIAVNPNITPTFTQILEICDGD